MAKYPEFDLTLTDAQKLKMKDIESIKKNELHRLIREFVDSTDTGFYMFMTVLQGATLGDFFDSIMAARNDLSQAFPHSYCGGLISNTKLNTLNNQLAEGGPVAAEDGALVSAYSQTMTILEAAKQMINVCLEIINQNTTNLNSILVEMDKRGLIPMRAVLKPLKMNTKYKVVTETGEFIASYDDQFIFTLEEVPDSNFKAEIPNEKLIFIGNVQASGDVHHLDDLPLFSTHTQLLFGKTEVPITTPCFMTSTVVHVADLKEIN